jgi:hypothetical protein
MRNIVENFTQETIFWDVNPQFTVINPFKRLWKSDKSRGKKNSSDLMWAISLAYHPKSDLYYVSDKEELIVRSHLGIKSAEKSEAFWKENDYLVKAFLDSALTEAEKSLISWNEGMKDRDMFLSNQKYTFGYEKDGVEYKDNTRSLDDMRSKTAKIYEEYFKIKRELEEEGSVKKNAKIQSSTATGEI